MVSGVTFVFLWHRETVLVTAAAGATGLAVIDVATNVLQAKVFACEILHLKKSYLQFSNMESIHSFIKNHVQGTRYLE